MATVYSFHGGPPLNVWERCSLQSFADQGHETVLFSYDRLDVPSGVRLESADRVISIEERDKFFAVAPDQYSQFSDFFRYELLHQRGGWWIDTDVLCRSPKLPSQPVVVGETRRGKLSGAIMRFPAGHPLLAEASAYCRSYQHNLLNSHRTVVGPMLMSDLIKVHPIEVRDRDLFYPIRTKHVWQFGEPESAGVVNQAVDSSPMVHWFQEFFRAAGLPREMLPPPGVSSRTRSWRMAAPMNFIFPSTTIELTRRSGKRKIAKKNQRLKTPTAKTLPPPHVPKTQCERPFCETARRDIARHRSCHHAQR